MAIAKELRHPLEGVYQRSLVARAALEIPSHRFFRRNVGMVQVGNSRVFRAGIAGQCDLYVLGKGGWHGEVEVKRFGVMSPDQVKWQGWCNSWGIPWVCLKAKQSEDMGVTVDRWVEELKQWLGNRPL